MNENANYHCRPEVLEELRAEQRPFLEWTCKQCETQVKEDRLFMMENPDKSRI